MRIRHNNINLAPRKATIKSAIKLRLYRESRKLKNKLQEGKNERP